MIGVSGERALEEYMHENRGGVLERGPDEYIPKRDQIQEYIRQALGRAVIERTRLPWGP